MLLNTRYYKENNTPFPSSAKQITQPQNYDINLVIIKKHGTIFI